MKLASLLKKTMACDFNLFLVNSYVNMEISKRFHHCVDGLLDCYRNIIIFQGLLYSSVYSLKCFAFSVQMLNVEYEINFICLKPRASLCVSVY